MSVTKDYCLLSLVFTKVVFVIVIVTLINFLLCFPKVWVKSYLDKVRIVGQCPNKGGAFKRWGFFLLIGQKGMLAAIGEKHNRMKVKAYESCALS